MGKGLQIGECRNPGDEEACGLCRDRLKECKADNVDDPAGCDTEFGVCKAFLITRGDVQAQCQEEEIPAEEVGCGICQKDYAVCLSDPTQPNALQVCAEKPTGTMA